MQKRKLIVEFNGGDLQTQNVHPMQLLPNDQLVTELTKISKELGEYFFHIVNACMHPQRYKSSDVARLLSSKKEIEAIRKGKGDHEIEAAYRMDELHEELEKSPHRQYAKSETRNTPMGQD